MASHNIPNSARLAEAALVALTAVPGYANSPEYINEIAPTAHVEVYNGPIPSEHAVQELHRYLGLASLSSAAALQYEAPSSGSDECPPPGHPEQTEVVYLDEKLQYPLCYNDGVLANPFDNPYICPNSTKSAGKVYDMNDPQGYAQCNTRTATQTAPTAAPTPTVGPTPEAQATLRRTEDTPDANTYGSFLAIVGALAALCVCVPTVSYIAKAKSKN